MSSAEKARRASPPTMAAARRSADLRRAATEAKLARARRMDEAREAEKARVERERFIPVALLRLRGLAVALIR